MRRLLAWAAGIMLAAAFVVTSGMLPLKASDGHWNPTAWVLRFASRRSMATWSSGIEVPPLDDPALVLQGAGHYDLVCRSCHGAPGWPSPPAARAMLPPPPDLGDPELGLDAAELFYATKHGIRLTGMPAWPTLVRDDEVWATVAFLLRLRELDEPGYEALVRVDDAGVPALAAPCAGCHGADGLGRGAWPRLAGQSEAFLAATLRAYADGSRPSGTMEAAVVGLDSPAIDALARWLATLPRGAAWPPGPDADLAMGEAVATGRVARVPGCVDCHGPGPGPRHPMYPTLAGQDPAWIVTWLRRFRDGTHGGTPFAGIMDVVAGHRLDDAQARDVAAWYAAQPAVGR